MVNYKTTLINIHKRFPELELETLLGIMDEIVEDPQFNITNGNNWTLNRDSTGDKYPWGSDRITCTNNTIKREPF